MSIVDKRIQNQLIQAMKALSEKPNGYDTIATVVRVDKKIAYVHIDNGADETPASMSVNASPGDVVVVHIENGQARITGNSTSPPTDDRVANTAIQTSSEARVIAEGAHSESTTAMSEANKAIGYADLAQDNANKALDSAQKALASADDAKVAADVAKENASKAISSADDAASAASDAQSKAEDATKSANNAGKAASAAQAAAEAAQGDIDEQKNYFWKDNEGAHILSEEEGKKINVTSDGIEVVSAKDSNTLMNVSSSKGVYFDENIPVTIGNDNANIKYYDSDNDGKADAISITASSIIFASSGKNVETSINEAKDTANNSVKSLVTEYASSHSSVIAPTEGWSSASPERKDGYYIWQRTVTKTSHDMIYSDPVCITGADGKDAVLLIIESSNGTMFKNTSIATNLTVTIIVGGNSITDSATMKKVFGDAAKLTWEQKAMGSAVWTELSADDSRLSDNGFIMTLTADDINEKTVFECSLDY